MLKKLIKHDFKSTRLVGLVFGFGLIIAFIWSILGPITAHGNSTAIAISGIFTIPTVIVFMAVMLIPTIMSAINFYRKMISDQAYLTFTLPVPRYYHIISKMIVHGAWSFISIIVLLVAIFIVAFGFALWGPEVVVDNETTDQVTNLIFQPAMVPLIVEIVILAIIEMFTAPLYVFASFSFGQVIMKKNKIVGAILAYYIMYIAISAVSSVISMVATFIVASNPNIMNAQYITIQTYTVIVGLFGLFSIVLSAALFWFTNFCLTKKLNLE